MNQKEYKINEHLELKLEENKTNLYVGGKFFIICKKLLLNIPTRNEDDFDNVKSIDDAVEVHERYFNQNEIENRQYLITPEEEFKGHCSNLQAWYENKYDTRLLHRNIAFQLLKRLTQVGDHLARKVYKEEIIHRIRSGESNVITYLIEEGFFDDFNKNELETLFEDKKIINNLLKILNNDNQNHKTTLINFLIRKTRKVGIDFLLNNLSLYINNLSFYELKNIINVNLIEINNFLNDFVLSFLIKEFVSLKQSDSVSINEWNELLIILRRFYTTNLDVAERHMNYGEFNYLIKKYYKSKKIDVEFKANKSENLVYKIKPINKVYYHKIIFEYFILRWNISQEKIHLLYDIKNAVFGKEDIILRDIKCKKYNHNEYEEEYQEEYEDYEKYESDIIIIVLVPNPELYGRI